MEKKEIKSVVDRVKAVIEDARSKLGDGLHSDADDAIAELEKLVDAKPARKD